MFIKTSMTALVFATTVSGLTSFASPADASIHFFSSRTAIASACSGGLPFDTNANSGSYGCVHDDFNIFCTGEGECVMDYHPTGGREVRPSRGQSALPPARN